MSLREEWDALDRLFDAPAEQIKLRPYQTDAITRIDESIGRGVRRIIAQLATGAGKTHIGLPAAGPAWRQITILWQQIARSGQPHALKATAPAAAGAVIGGGVGGVQV
jgi:Type III restriction enzyme, res subunit